MIQKKLIEWRRHLHQHPELSFQEYETAKYIEAQLDKLPGVTYYRPTETSVVARIQGANPGKVVAIRADIDALPIQEENEVEYASQNPGVMHACGHDGHTAMLLGLATLLSENRESLSGDYRLFFQHAEELPPGGAKQMVEAGVMEEVDYVIGAHLLSVLPVGVFGVSEGPVSSSNDNFTIKLLGKGGHSAMPQLSIDVISIGAQIVNALNHITSRCTDPLDSPVLSVCKFQAGTAYNVLPDTAELQGSVRTFSKATKEMVEEKINSIVRGICEAYGAKYEVHYEYGYDSIVNDPFVTEKVRESIQETFGEKSIIDLQKNPASEDFSAFSNVKPGCYFAIGARNEAKGIVYPHHHPKFNIDEDALWNGLQVLYASATKLAKTS